ncbi:hypothetical protein [Phyllobacterium sophorae]|uniref:Uncharacterized protein n=1 Tax=Phyllobacterium sophorae TaxID=1520277 RepID=A0A2P7AXR4_9HYPH|nr:hypothetical protein [Phyllobacterium sophorae]PSH58997.1 hypothetical protein CU103_27390 [Phyllobacterium sophorae]
MSKKDELRILHAFEMPVVKDNRTQMVIVSSEELGGVYLRLLKRSTDPRYDIFQVNIVIKGIEYETEQSTRVAAGALARAIADLAIISPYDDD